MARLHPVKDQLTLLRAVRLVVDEIPGFELDVIGDGPLRETLEREVADLGIGGHVRFLGMRSDVAPLLRDAGLFVLSSLSEGVSLTLLESMASALPAVATDVGGNREVVRHGHTGYLVPVSDPPALAAAIRELVLDPALAQRMGRAARERCVGEFSLENTVRQYEELYTDLVGRRSRGHITRLVHSRG